MKAYIVLLGDPGADGDIIGVFANKEKASEFCEEKRGLNSIDKWRMEHTIKKTAWINEHHCWSIAIEEWEIQ